MLSFQAHETCKTAAGFSLGEITALVYSGAISFEDGKHVTNGLNCKMFAPSKINQKSRVFNTTCQFCLLLIFENIGSDQDSNCLTF